MQEWRGPYLTGTEIRYYNPKERKWTGRNLYVNGSWKQTTAKRYPDKMVVIILNAEDKTGTFQNRETYHDIEKDSFKMISERSYDNGKTWVKGNYHMKASRVD